MRHLRPRKVSGAGLSRFLTRFYAAEPGMAPAMADNLVRRSLLAFTSVRVRPGARLMLGTPGWDMIVGEASRREPTPAVAPIAKQLETAAAPKPTPPPPVHRDEPQPAASDGKFDPYAIGLVPTFQREGRAGLLFKLQAVTTLAQLRQMARAQQIALDAKFKSDDITADVLRAAIADAVDKRIRDRKAAGD